MGTKRLTGAETRLEKRVQAIVNSHAADYEEGAAGFIADLRYGCQSGLVGELVYYKDTLRFYKLYRDEINTLLTETLEGIGDSPRGLFGDKWDAEDPLALGVLNQNLLAWFAFEETAFRLARENSIGA